MKKLTVISLVALVAAVAAWSAYAYAQGGGPLKGILAASKPACDPSTQPCEKVQACHHGAACPCDAATDCPKFKDADGDGKCDTASDCDWHGHPGCRNGASPHEGRTACGHGCGRHGNQ